MLKGLSWFPSGVTLLAGVPARAQVDNSPHAPTASKDEVTINGSTTPLPKLPPDQFADCYARGLVYSDQSNYDAALQDFTAAIHLQPKKASAVERARLCFPA
ncbi:MAG: tetratricopeptide repeat protein [Proteobacteria bacterium]|nr:tetratricopeptide repeat protein [Pseudomonadota bacterium]